MGKWWWPILKFYEKWSFKKANKIFFITPEDREFATEKWNIDKRKCVDLPFGIDISTFPNDKPTSKAIIKEKHKIASSEIILFFNGVLDYKPNIDALKVILNKINPILLNEKDFQYKILITGKKLPEELNSLKEYAEKNVIFVGFVDSIDIYYKATDIFLNPVQSGGGIKTKMVEGIAFGATVIATATGSTGMERAACGNKLKVVADNDWKSFAECILVQSAIQEITPVTYYEKYYWGNIIKSIITHI